MERGEQIVVLGIMAIVSTLALANLFLTDPTGKIAQGETVYQEVQDSPIPCEQMNPVLFLRREGAFNVYCCPEDMIGQNTCKEPHRILTT